MIHPVIVPARCCREWPVLYGSPIGRCGYCGRHPMVTRAVV